jgi:peptide/nickel transport system substrate-binding protein
MRRLIAALLALAFIGGCAPVQKTIPGVLRMGESEEPDSLNLMYGNNASTDEISSLLYSSILRFDDNGNLFPDLALAVPTKENRGISADGKTITVHLRKNARWSDGQPLTSADWIYTYRAVNNPKNNIKSNYGWGDIASAEAPDAYTIVVHLKKPSVAAFDVLTMGGTAYPPLPSHALANAPDLNKAAINSAPISSGPFVLKAWNHGSALVFEPNPYYWRGPAHLKQLIWKILPDNNTQFSQLQTHEIDLYRNVDANSVSRLSSLKDIVVTHRLLANWRHLGINMSRPILSDIRVRQAIASGIDWKYINDTIYHGIHQLAVSDVFPQLWAAPKLPPYVYDRAHAQALLAEAGWMPGPNGIRMKNGQPLHLTISANNAAKSNEQSEVVMQSQMRALGIDLQIRNYPASLFFARNGPL